MPNGTHVALGSSITGYIALVLMWVTHWPLHSLDDQTATAIGSLIVMFFGGGGVAVFASWKNSHSQVAPFSAENTTTGHGTSVGQAPASPVVDPILAARAASLAPKS